MNSRVIGAYYSLICLLADEAARADAELTKREALTELEERFRKRLKELRSKEEDTKMVQKLEQLQGWVDGLSAGACRQYVEELCSLPLSGSGYSGDGAMDAPAQRVLARLAGELGWQGALHYWATQNQASIDYLWERHHG